MAQTFARPEEAQQLAIIKALRLRAQGLVLTTSKAQAHEALCVRVPRIEAELLGQQEYPGRYQIYADCLLERGDIRGELINLMLHNQDVEPWLREHQAQLLGPLAFYSPRLKITWKWGFIHAIAFSQMAWREAADALSAVFASALGLGLRSLAGDGALAQALSQRSLPASVGRLELSEVGYAIGGDDLAKLILPLNSFLLKNLQYPLPALHAPHLRSLELLDSQIDAALNSVAEAKLPALEQLRVLGHIFYGGEEDGLSAAWDRLVQRRFAHLKAVEVDAASAPIPSLVDSPFFAPVQRLKLRGHDVDRALCEQLLQHPALLQGRRVEIDLDLTPRRLRRRLRAAGYIVN